MSSVATAVDRDPATAAPAESRLKITEIFVSLQGEARDAGWRSAFVRLTGCPLRCGYCDTAYAFHGGEWRTIDDILATVAGFGVSHVCVTGGEPLAQKRCIELLRRLCDAGYQVSLETSGAIDIAPVDTRVSRIVDLKTPGSGEMARNRYENIALLTSHDQVKFVLTDRLDYDWARAQVGEHRLDQRCEVLFSPGYRQVTPTELADWMIADRVPARMQIQLHKLLWGDAQGK